MATPTAAAAFGIGGSSFDHRRSLGDNFTAKPHATNAPAAGNIQQRSQTDVSRAPASSLNAFLAHPGPPTFPAPLPITRSTKQPPPILGEADCETCKDTPAFQLTPCGHTICFQHYVYISSSVLEDFYAAFAVCAHCGNRVVSGIPAGQSSHSSESTDLQLTAATSTSTSTSSGPAYPSKGALVGTKSRNNSPPKSVTFNLPAEGLRRQGEAISRESVLSALRNSLPKPQSGSGNSQLGTSSSSAAAGARSEPFASQAYTTQESSLRKPLFFNPKLNFIPMDQRRSSLGSSANPTQISQASQQPRLGSFQHSKSTPNMTELGTGPTSNFSRGASIWNTHSSSHNVGPRITPSPIAESPDEDVFSQPSSAGAPRNEGGKTQANDFPSSDIIDEINARMPQLSLRHGSFTSGSSFAPSRQNTTPSTTPSKGAAGRSGSHGSISPHTAVPFQGDIEQSATPTPFDKGRAEKRRLVDLIKSGVLTPDDDQPTQTAVVPRQRDQVSNNAAQYTPTFVDLEYHVTNQESAQFFEYLQKLGGQLSLSDAFTLIPFVEKARIAKPKHWGVIKITNIPYGTTKPEIVAFVGRNARLVQQPQASPWYAIHIIMERSTAKTMDCFVEFETQKDADHAVDRFKRQCANHRHPRIGDRHVDVTESSQAALMKDLFPKAKCVRWEGQDPHPYETTEPYNSGFQGFTNSEEMVMTLKHAETPQRSPFSHKCYQRTYESIISLLYKFPWWSVENYTLAERDRIHYATVTLIKALQNHRFRHNPTNPQQLTPQLHQELVFAGLNCPGFSESQKHAILKTAANGREITPGRDTWWGLSQYAPSWVFQTLGRKEGVGEDMLHYFIKLLHDASTSADFLSLAEHRTAILAVQNGKSSPFGKCEPQFETDAEHTTMADAAHLEWTTIESYLRRVLPTSRRSSSTSIVGQITEH